MSFVGPSQVWNEISDVDFLIHDDDDYLTEKDEKSPLSEKVGTSGCANTYIAMIRSLSSR